MPVRFRVIRKTCPRRSRSVPRATGSSGNPNIVHHAVTSVIPPEGTDLTDSGFVGGEFEEYAVGKYGDIYPENTGRLLPANSRIAFDMHYFAIGQEAKDRTTLGIVFYPKGYVPKYKITMVSF